MSCQTMAAAASRVDNPTTETLDAGNVAFERAASRSSSSSSQPSVAPNDPVPSREPQSPPWSFRMGAVAPPTSPHPASSSSQDIATETLGPSAVRARTAPDRPLRGALQDPDVDFNGRTRLSTSSGGAPSRPRSVARLRGKRRTCPMQTRSGLRKYTASASTMAMTKRLRLAASTEKAEAEVDMLDVLGNELGSWCAGTGSRETEEILVGVPADWITSADVGVVEVTAGGGGGVKYAEAPLRKVEVADVAAAAGCNPASANVRVLASLVVTEFVSVLGVGCVAATSAAATALADMATSSALVLALGSGWSPTTFSPIDPGSGVEARAARSRASACSELPVVAAMAIDGAPLASAKGIGANGVWPLLTESLLPAVGMYASAVGTGTRTGSNATVGAKALLTFSPRGGLLSGMPASALPFVTWLWRKEATLPTGVCMLSALFAIVFSWMVRAPGSSLMETALAAAAAPVVGGIAKDAVPLAIAPAAGTDAVTLSATATAVGTDLLELATFALSTAEATALEPEVEAAAVGVGTRPVTSLVAAGAAAFSAAEATPLETEIEAAAVVASLVATGVAVDAVLAPSSTMATARATGMLGMGVLAMACCAEAALMTLDDAVTLALAALARALSVLTVVEVLGVIGAASKVATAANELIEVELAEPASIKPMVEAPEELAEAAEAVKLVVKATGFGLG